MKEHTVLENTGPVPNSDVIFVIKQIFSEKKKIYLVSALYVTDDWMLQLLSLNPEVGSWVQETAVPCMANWGCLQKWANPGRV